MTATLGSTIDELLKRVTEDPALSQEVKSALCEIIDAMKATYPPVVLKLTEEPIDLGIITIPLEEVPSMPPTTLPTVLATTPPMTEDSVAILLAALAYSRPSLEPTFSPTLQPTFSPTLAPTTLFDRIMKETESLSEDMISQICEYLKKCAPSSLDEFLQRVRQRH